MADLLRLYGRMKQEYRKVVKFFGEDPAKMRIDDFFGSFTAFITDFEVCQLQEVMLLGQLLLEYHVCIPGKVWPCKKLN